MIYKDNKGYLSEDKYNMYQRIECEICKETTPDELLSLVNEVKEKFGDDEEVSHGMTDSIMESMLIALGYGEAVKEITSIGRWYC